ncbi:MAG: hypothetical protein HYX20_01280 [Candidatus Yanofskybacteria bacterium]|nr:hypothetical protein [Candidatus Yanofskybacteria bacterium]
MIGNQQQQIIDIIQRATRKPQGQECWQLRKSGGCLECGGFATKTVLGCHDYHCPQTDHRSCGETSITCPHCAGTGLGVVALFQLLHDIGQIVGIKVNIPTRQDLRG